MRSGFGLPVITVSLLPDWDQEQLEKCFDGLVYAAAGIPEMQVEGEKDVIVLFPKDAMQKGLGTEIVIKVDLPAYFVTDTDVENDIASSMVTAMQLLLPSARIECSVDKREAARGFWATGMDK